MKSKSNLQIKSKLKMFPIDIKKIRISKNTEKSCPIEIEILPSKKSVSMDKIGSKSYRSQKSVKLKHKMPLTNREMILRAVREVKAEAENNQTELSEESEILLEKKTKNMSMNNNLTSKFLPKLNKEELTSKVTEIKKTVLHADKEFRNQLSPNHSMISGIRGSMMSGFPYEQRNLNTTKNSFFRYKLENSIVQTARESSQGKSSPVLLFGNLLDQTYSQRFDRASKPQTPGYIEKEFLSSEEYSQLITNLKENDFTAKDSYCFQKA